MLTNLNFISVFHSINKGMTNSYFKNFYSNFCSILNKKCIFIPIILRLYKERLSQVDAKLQEVIAGKAPEYLEPLAALQENMQIRTKVAGRHAK